MIRQVNYLHKTIMISALIGTLSACGAGSNPSNSNSNITYAPFNCPGSDNVSFPGVSGVRQVYGSTDVYVTGVKVEYGSSHAFLYKGPVTGGGECNTFNYPSDIGRTVTSTSLYGPDSSGSNQVVLTGSYTTLESGPIAQQGFLYIGKPDGSTTTGYTTLFPQSLTNESIINTLGHSTMGGIVVGNYDTHLITGQAFIYSIQDDEYYPLEKPVGSASITAYGIWYNGGTSYTIAGGYSDVLESGEDIGFITDWDSVTHEISHFKSLNYNNLPRNEVGTHFEGITTDDNGGYNLAGDWQYLGQKTTPTFAHITRNPDGSFSDATWVSYGYYPGSSWTSANTVYKNYILGLYQAGTPTLDYGYVVTIQ